ncbi:SUMF1/EgtB/PvdO family nonheme iron enzyme [Rhizobium leguminosarum]|uniref:SUMF1/EgtB/PvdO family nonheme iron enzyme n=1 Tax=Rhizobium leguminosarum TaxID=384 RepID=UPI0013E2E573|nr:SUMF1/EgtB/PvdO family nonheme iron enzyme [Rhizobium leguminosarum]
MTSQTNEVHAEKRKVTVGDFREFVSRTSYLTDCERRGGGWIYVRRKWEQKPDASWDNPYMEQDEEDPVVLVSWHDAVMFANWKSHRESLGQAYRFVPTDTECLVSVDFASAGYRLPTEHEWEAAPSDPLVPGTNSRKSVNAVAQVFPGGLWGEGGWQSDRLEWCWDPGNPAGNQSIVDFSTTGFAQPRICRGGSTVGQNGRQPSRGACDPFAAATTLGFSLVRGDRTPARIRLDD